MKQPLPKERFKTSILSISCNIGKVFGTIIVGIVKTLFGLRLCMIYLDHDRILVALPFIIFHRSPALHNGNLKPFPGKLIRSIYW